MPVERNAPYGFRFSCLPNGVVGGEFRKVQLRQLPSVFTKNSTR
jgi:hypothetical protein